MKFLKTFKQINENEREKKIFFLYTVCDETYGYININLTTNYGEVNPDEEPCRYSTEDYIISEDDENSKEGREILAKQSGGVYDNDFNYDYEEEEYADWREETIENTINEYHSTDLWGQVYICSGYADLESDLYSDDLYDLDKDGYFPSKKKFEEERLEKDGNIIKWASIKSDGDSKSFTDIFFELYDIDPVGAAELYNQIPSHHKSEVWEEAQRRGKKGSLRSIATALDKGIL
jgi:hypothetical protein